MTVKIGETNVIQTLKKEKEIFWVNPNCKQIDEANENSPYSIKDIQNVEARCQTSDLLLILKRLFLRQKQTKDY